MIICRKKEENVGKIEKTNNHMLNLVEKITFRLKPLIT